jgi:hypothetical protein
MLAAGPFDGTLRFFLASPQRRTSCFGRASRKGRARAEGFHRKETGTFSPQRYDQHWRRSLGNDLRGLMVLVASRLRRAQRVTSVVTACDGVMVRRVPGSSTVCRPRRAGCSRVTRNIRDHFRWALYNKEDISPR